MCADLEMDSRLGPRTKMRLSIELHVYLYSIYIYTVYNNNNRALPKTIAKTIMWYQHAEEYIYYASPTGNISDKFQRIHFKNAHMNNTHSHTVYIDGIFLSRHEPPDR